MAGLGPGFRFEGRNPIQSQMKKLILTIASLLAASAAASASTAPTDRAASLLSVQGSVHVRNASRPHGDGYAELGSSRERVVRALGTPAAVASDGSYLYRDSTVVGSDARGLLVVRFENGRVKDLSLVPQDSRAADRAVIAQR